MPGASDEQTWWSSLFSGGADPGLDLPDGLWESMMTTVLDDDMVDPADDLIPEDQPDTGFDWPDEGPGLHHEFDPATTHGDAVAHEDVGHTDFDAASDDAYNDFSDQEDPYDIAPDESGVDGTDAIDDQL